MNDLEIAKRIAEIEGIEVFKEGNHLLTPDDQGYFVRNNKTCGYYNPFRWATLGPLMLKHNITPSMRNLIVSTRSSTGRISIFRVKTKEEIPRAILECIIKSKEQ
jgi:hypothetical protein